MFTHAPLHHAQDSGEGDVENPPSDHLSSSEILTNRPDRVVLKVDQETFSNGKNLQNLVVRDRWSSGGPAEESR
jgi:hypothetical protein